MSKLDQLIDSHTLGRLPEADQAKYQKQDDGTYKLVGDPNPTVRDEGALPLFVDTDHLAGMPDVLKGYYTDKWTDINGKPGEEGRWKLRGHEDVTALKNAYGRVKAQLETVETKAKRYEDAGIDPDEFKRLKDMRERLEREKEVQRSEFDKQFTEASEQYKTEIKVRDDQIQKLQANLQRALINEKASIDIAAADGSPDLLLPHIQSRAQVQEVDGRYIAVVLGDDGKPRLKKGAQKATDFLPIREYVEELREDERFAGAFRGTGSSGSGATKGRDADHSGAPATVSKNDPKAIGIYADAIAAGKTRVV